MRWNGSISEVARERREFGRFRDLSGRARMGDASHLEMIRRLESLGVGYRFRYMLTVPERYKADFYLIEHGILIEMDIDPSTPPIWARRIRDKRQRLFGCRESVKCLMLARCEVSDFCTDHIKILSELPNGVYQFSDVNQVTSC